MAEFVLGEVLVARDQGIEVEGLLVWRVNGKLEIVDHVADVDVVDARGRLVVGAILRLLGLAAGGKLELVGDVLPHGGLGGVLRLGVSEDLIWEVLRTSMVWEILSVLALDDEVELSELLERASGEQLHLKGPNDSHTHVLPGVCHDGAGQMVRIDSHEALLIETKVGEELCILPEMSRQLLGRLVNRSDVVLLLVGVLEDILIFEEASLTDEDLDVVVNWEQHQLPVDSVKNLTLHVDDDIGGISLMDHVIECVSTRILGLQILGGDQQSHERDQDGIVVSFLWHFRRVKVHQIDSMMDGLVVTLQAISNIAEIVNSLDPFLQAQKFKVSTCVFIKSKFLTVFLPHFKIIKIEFGQKYVELFLIK